MLGKFAKISQFIILRPNLLQNFKMDVLFHILFHISMFSIFNVNFKLFACVLQRLFEKFDNSIWFNETSKNYLTRFFDTLDPRTPCEMTRNKSLTPNINLKRYVISESPLRGVNVAHPEVYRHNFTIILFQ